MMEYRRLGRTDEKVSTIGMGTWRMGVYRNLTEKAEEVRALKRGFELGINLVDTAEGYADGRSEHVVGEAIKGIRDDVFIATKVSPENLHHEDVLEACERSLRRLRTSYVDLYQVHWPNPSVPIKETMSAMEKLVKDGKVRHSGVSNFGVRETAAARESLARSEIASNQVEYSFANRSVEAEILPYCEKEKVTLIAYSPLAMGNILESRVPRGLREKYGLTTAQVMLNWVARSDAVIAISKSARIHHTEENAASVSLRFTRSEYAEIA